MKKFLDQEKEREREEKNFGDSVLTYYSEYPMKRKNNNKTRQVLTVPVLYYSILELPPARFILKLLLLFIL